MKNDNTQTTYTVPVPKNKAGLRLDKFLAGEVEGYSRSRLKALMDAGHVALADGPATDASKKVKEGDVYTVTIPPVVAAEPKPQNIPLTVVYEDDDVIVIDKPPGLVVHPAAGNADGTLVNALLAHCGDSLSGIGGVARPGIVHRLDKGTGGLIIAAKNDAAHVGLSKQFADHSMDRAYLALVWGVPMPPKGEIEGNIGRSPNNRKKMAIVERGGKYALTRYKVLKTFGDVAALVECRLATGRTHQIRVHMASIGHSLIGDPVYGGSGRSKRSKLQGEAREAVDNLDHQALYAYELGFIHPKTQQKIVLQNKKDNFINAMSQKLERY
ncbi:MAG: RNA pseudouridine synthase [Rhodospirillaceae bacterium]|nr:MAG: RNA pseudouridine synthase [Rhodospirillaceae bacterium]